MDWAIVEVPAMAGDPSHPAAAGPAALTAALGVSGAHRVDVSRDPTRATVDVVRSIARAARRPLVLAGSCDVAPAVLAGIGDAECGVVWIDAHADFNTPESSVSGFRPGMTLAVVVGDCGDEVLSAVGARPVSQRRVALLGVRSLSPAAEAERLARSALHVVAWRDGEPTSAPVAALDRLARDAARVYVHLD